MMQWSTIYGQDKAKQGLLNYHQSEHLPHAILILGKEGSGGLALALAFARYLLCEQKHADGTICGICAACLKTKNLVHPDLHLTFPSVPMKPGEKAMSKNNLADFRKFVQEHPYGSVFDWLQFVGATSNQKGNISAEECRQMIETLGLKASEGAYKIQIIWRPEYLGKEGNILLKLIEEPPDNTVFLLVAESTDAVLDTILSRTQQIRLQPLSIEAVQSILTINYKVSDREAAQVAQIAEGNVSHALTALHQNESDLLETLKQWFNGVFTYNGLLIGKWVEQMDKTSKVQQKNFLMFAQQLLSQAMRIQFIPNYQAPLPQDELQFVQRLSTRNFSAETVRRMDEEMSKAIYHLERNANAKIVLLHLSVALQYILKGTELKAL
ncbi:hypothetical protein DBR32_04020 [Taibaiella sp. KBW10]|uniref:DNA polymerase III subunit n=1 Tax=Taibaiella sp. KBW10 TaxID=2153357 RepID=UPI000F5A5371|nr:DNA polymerase III subunit delta' [Taibaiella sp. KBW10]RQO31976.1 hypothetical protein DBR32_04020 [Taibaiella sp. KBW10]